MKRLPSLTLVGIAGIMGWTLEAAASDVPPWVDATGPALPQWAKSVRIANGDQALLIGPAGASERRGTAAFGALLPLFASRVGPGCGGRWFSIGPLAWVCEDGVELSGNEAIPAAAHTLREAADGLPFRYFFVGPDGSFGYRRLQAADVAEPDTQLEPGFAVAVVEERAAEGTRYGLTRNGFWVPMRDLGAIAGVAFRGVDIAPGAAALDIGWIVADRARVYTKPTTAAPSGDVVLRFERIHVLEESTGWSAGFLRIGEGRWVQAKDVRRPTMSEPPAEVTAEDERWIDVELASQTLVAYVGRSPVFATMVSTGKGREGSPLATPKGVHRIWVKLLTSNMDNLEDENAARYYRMEDVPYVQYFAKGVGLHGAFWHRSFGRVRSHGCVNLAPLDAQKLFWWTGPHLPAGWSAVLPTAYERGTVIRVR